MNNTIFFIKKPYIVSNFTVVGPKEGSGPLREYFDVKLEDDKLGQDTFEQSESMMQITAVKGAIKRANKQEIDIQAIIAGDLVNEIIASTFAAKSFTIPYLGVYNACSTFAEAIVFASSLISGDLRKTIACVTSSHFSSVERQYRYPLELGTQPTPTSQWTVTGAGCTILSSEGQGAYVECATLGRVIDMGIKDANNMGGAMAPAAVDTMLQHIRDTGREPNYYDMIFTGDLGRFGSSLFKDLMMKSGYSMGENYNDCGAIIFSGSKAHQGGSGAGCANVVFNAYLLKQLSKTKNKRLLLIPTGALLSKVSSLQGESIPCIAHAISITM